MKSPIIKALLLGTVLGMATVSAAPLMAQTTQDDLYRNEVAADKAFPLLKGFLGLPVAERDAISLNYVLRIKNGNPKDARILLKHQGQETQLSILGDGRISPLPTLAQMNAGARIEVTGPSTMSVAMRLRVYPTAKPAKTMAAAPLIKAVDQTNRVARKVGGVLALALPKQDRIYFDGTGNGTVTLSDGSTKTLPKTPKADIVPAGTPYFVPDDFKGATSLTFDQVPKRVLVSDRIK